MHFVHSFESDLSPLGYFFFMVINDHDMQLLLWL